ncbi:MAG: hypothetical protein JXP73_14600 [Deltaproteobacteria bacterium]|nr:hypothetical protein [Deltaproteobacteria bacterium]
MTIKPVILLLAIATSGIWANGCGSVDCRDDPENGDRCDISDEYVCLQVDNCAWAYGCLKRCVCRSGQWDCLVKCSDPSPDGGSIAYCGTAPLCWNCGYPPAGIDAAAP